MKLFFILLFSTLTSITFSNDFYNNKPRVKKQEIEYLNKEVIKYIIKFYDLLPEIKGKIISLPRAGTVKIKFYKDKIRIHEGMRLIAKRKKGDKYIGSGIIYLKYNNNELLGRYTRAQVGKFEMYDEVNTKWYKPTITIAMIKDDINYNRDLTSYLRLVLKTNFKKNKDINFKENDKIKIILAKISTVSNYNRGLKMLFGLGIDYVLFGKFIKGESNNIFNIKIISTYTNKTIFDINIDAKF